MFLKKKSSLNNFTLIFEELKSNGLNPTLATFAVSQAAHETAVLGIPFMSPLFKNNNNAFGMKTADLTTFKKYASVGDSTVDFIKWYATARNRIFSLPLIIHDLPDYVKFLKNNAYFEAPEAEYLTGCEHFYNQFFA
jgi:uncharacterized FlgJ-related protein